MGLGGTQGGASMSYGTNIDAIDYKTGKVVWRHSTIARSPGILTTAGNLLFSGDGEYLIALNATTGATLWHSKVGTVGNPPETYMLDGKQYVLVATGEGIYAFVLNQSAPMAAAKKPATTAKGD